MPLKWLCSWVFLLYHAAFGEPVASQSRCPRPGDHRSAAGRARYRNEAIARSLLDLLQYRLHGTGRGFAEWLAADRGKPSAWHCSM